MFGDVGQSLADLLFELSVMVINLLGQVGHTAPIDDALS